MVKRVRDPEARERLVDTARRAVAEFGLRGATVRVIAAKAGVSTGSVMHHFADKDLLARAVLDLNNARAAERVQTARRGKRGIRALAAMVDALLPLDAERRLSWRVWVAFWNDEQPTGSRGLLAARGALAAILAEPFAEAIEDGDVPAELDVPFEIDRLITMTAGLGLLAGVTPIGEVRRLARRMLESQLAEFRARERT